MNETVIINSLLRVRKETRANGKVDIKLFIRNYKSDKFILYSLSVDEAKAICNLLQTVK